MPFSAISAAFSHWSGAGDYQLWEDTIQSSPTWQQWPDTLAVILVEFTDVKHDSFWKADSAKMWAFDKTYTWQDFYNLLASDSSYLGESPDKEKVFGSLRDYFYSMSQGAYRPVVEILNDMIAVDQPPVWYNLQRTKEYYVGLGREPESFLPLTNHAIELAREDGKNVTTNARRRICVIYAGNRRNGLGAWADLGGDRYMAFERWKYDTKYGYDREYKDAPLAHIGVHAHEFSHLRCLGHVSSNRWSLLGDGQKNGPDGSSFGACPAPLNPWFRSLDDWVSIETIMGDVVNARLVYNGTPNYYKIGLTRSDGRTESILVENRQFSSGFDRYLPGANGGTGVKGGLLIWDILGNDPSSHLAVDLIEADNTPINDPSSLPTDIFRPDGPYPYSVIFDYSSPANLKLRDSTLSHFAVENYTSNGDTITVNFRTSYLSGDTSIATALSNGRKLIRDSGGAYHLVYDTEGEIYYQKSTDGGASWGAYKRLGPRTGNNHYPSITGTSTKQFVVWQRYKATTGKYDTYFARNLGSGWSTAAITNLSNLTSTTDPLPVVTYKAKPGGGYRLLVCAKNSSGIRYVTNDGDGEASQWSAAGRIPSTGSAHQNPSLSMGPTTPAATVYLTYDDGAQVYLNSYTTAWGSPENVSSTSGCTGNTCSTVEVDSDSGQNVAWEAKKKSNNKYVIVHRRKTTSWEPYVYFEPASTSTRYHRPCITGLSQERRAIVWHDEGGAVYRALTANGLSWSVEAWTDTYLQHPNLSAGRTDSARFVFTGGNAAPYRIYLSGSLPPPGGQAKALLASGDADDEVRVFACPLRHHRAVLLSDKEGDLLAWLQYGEMEARSRKGDCIPLELVSCAGAREEETVPEVFAYLATQPLVLPHEVDSLVWEQELSAKGLEALVDWTSGTPAVQVELVDEASGQAVAVLHRSTLGALSQEARVAVDISPYAGKEVAVAVRPVGFPEGMEKVRAALGEVFIVSSPFGREALPKPEGQVGGQGGQVRVFCLEQSYPNPCNPCAEVRYQLPERCHVTLAVFNLMGEEVRRLVEGVQEPGVHLARWDGTDAAGRQVASGVYLYRLVAGSQVASRKL
ncbi:MAG: hypothetical protein NUW13_16040, partial [candidate division KSB1 bacterium]|nr:hypothetical protein [candidate division KSB1 bacterium]